MLFGLYVIFHGHYSPGGGFQGGTLLAASIILTRLAMGEESRNLQLAEDVTQPMAVVGVFLFFGTGLFAMFYGKYFLDYSALPFTGLKPAKVRFFGILIVEIGIGIGVMAILVMIYDNLVLGENHD